MNTKILGILGLMAVVAVVPPAIATEDGSGEYTDVYEDAEDSAGADVSELDADTPDVIVDVPAPRAVGERMTCPEINERVSELREDIKAYPELAADLEYMLSRQRIQCAPRANRRPVRNYANVNPVMVVDAVSVDVQEEPASVVDVVSVMPEKPVEQAPEKTPEELAAEQAAAQAKIKENMANGLCGDGTKPNRFGCCAGERFKEVSQMKFACCPTTGDGECHEPLKKE